MFRFRSTAVALAALLVAASLSFAQGAAGQASADKPASAAKPPFDEALAKKVGADDYGMRNYVLVVLKTGPTKVPAGPERDAMFKGHFANMERLSKEGKLALAGPFGGGGAADGWRGLFIFAVADVEEAKKLVATDPAIMKGELIAEYHPWYGSAALMLVPDAHGTVAKKSF